MDQVASESASNRKPGETALGNILHTNIDKAISKFDAEPRGKAVESVALDPEAEAGQPKPRAKPKPKDPSASNLSEQPAKGQAAQDDAPEETKSTPEPRTAKTEETPAADGSGAPTQAKTESGEDNPFAPKHWSDEERKAFSDAPPEVQKAIDKMVKNLQAGFTKKTQALAQAKQIADGIAEAIQPHHRQEMQSLGVNEGAVLKNFLNLHDQFRRDPVSYVKMLMQSTGMTPAHLGFNPQAPQPPALDPAPAPDGGQADPTLAPAAIPPELKALQDKIEALEKGWTEAQQRQVSQQRQTAAHELTQIQNGIASFANEVGTDGMLTHPHFEKLEAQIGGILQTDPTVLAIANPMERLQAAYDRAVWQNPETREQTKQAEIAAQRSQWEAERAKSAISAKPRSGTDAAKPVAGKKSLDDALQSAMRKAGI